jgi:hypothetical protein
MESVVLMDSGCSLPHDAGGALLRMGLEATALASQAQDLLERDPRKKQLLERAGALRVQERLGWLAVRTSEFPGGDLEGAAKASMALAVYHMQLLELEKGRQWLETALAEAPQDKVFLRVIIAHNMRTLQYHIRELSSSSTPAQSGRSSPVPAAGEQPAGDVAAAIERLGELTLAPR